MLRTYLITLIVFSTELGSDPALVQGVITTEINLDKSYLLLGTDKEIYDFNGDFWSKYKGEFSCFYTEKYAETRCRILQWQELNYEKAREQTTKAN